MKIFLKTLLITIICFTFILSENNASLNKVFLSENKTNGDPKLDQEMADFLNGIFGTSLGLDILKKCSVPYKPEDGSHSIFLEQYKKSSSSAQSIISKKSIKKITGETCEYNTSDPNVYTDAKKTEIPTSLFFSSSFHNTGFGKGFIAFTNCMGKTQLYDLTDPVLVDQIFFLFSNEKTTLMLFQSFCTVNNIFSQIKTVVDSKTNNAFEAIGKQLYTSLILTKPHYQYLIK